VELRFILHRSTLKVEYTFALVIENGLGQLNMIASSSGIYFYVQRYGSLPAVAANGVIRFNQERLNMGGAMNITMDVFTDYSSQRWNLSFLC